VSWDVVSLGSRFDGLQARCEAAQRLRWRPQTILCLLKQPDKQESASAGESKYLTRLALLPPQSRIAFVTSSSVTTRRQNRLLAFGVSHAPIQWARTLGAGAVFSVLLFGSAAVPAQTSRPARKSTPPPQAPANMDCAQVPRKYWPTCKIPMEEEPIAPLREELQKKVQTKRMLWVVSNFGAVSSNTELPPLSARGKFDLAFHDSFDYSSFTWTAIEAAQGLAARGERLLL